MLCCIIRKLKYIENLKFGHIVPINKNRKINKEKRFGNKIKNTEK
jgi:hypothetical protein